MDPSLPKTVQEVRLPFPSGSLGQKIIMFGLPTCPHCANVKKFLADKNVEYEYQDVSVEGKSRDS